MQPSLKNMLSRLDCQVGMQNELSRVDAQFFLWGKLKGVVSSRGKVDRAHMETRGFHDRQPCRYQRLLCRGVRIDMQTVGYPEVEINLGRALCGNSYLRGVKELNRIISGQVTVDPSSPAATPQVRQKSAWRSETFSWLLRPEPS